MNGFTLEKESVSLQFDIYVAGSYDDCIRICRSYTLKGACVSVRKTTYVYTGGVEDGVVVTLINYPRFESQYALVYDNALELGSLLASELCQLSFSIQGPDVCQYFTRDGYRK